MKRLTLIKLHLYFSGVALIFMTLMALSGSMHLLLGDETERVEKIKSLTLETPLNKDELTTLFASELKKVNPSYQYDYIKGSDLTQTSRPTSRTYYSIKLEQGLLIIRKHTPSLLKRLMEFHKGHGPRISRPILGTLGLIVVLALMSGFWLGWTAPNLRKITLITMLSGGTIYFGLLLFL